MNRQQLDARRLLCPMPVIKTQNLAASLRPGDEIEVICTDPGALNDIPAWARINGHEVIQSTEHDNEIVIIVRIGA